MSSIDKDWAENNIDSSGEVTIPEGMQRIEKGAFQGNEKVKRIIMPNSINFIGPRAFADCPNLQEVVFSENLQVLGQNAFRNCSQLTQVNIPSHVKILYPGTFDGNTSLDSISLSEDLEYLSADAFSNCDNVKEVNISGVKRVDYNAFIEKTGITKITIDGQEFMIGENQQLFSVQKVGERVAIVTQQEDGKFATQCVNIEKNTSKTIGNNIYLTNDGKMCYAINSLAETSLNALKQFQKAGLTQLYIYGGESEITPDQHNEGLNFNLYSIEDLIQVKSKIENIKNQIKLPNSKDSNREKKIYGQIVAILGKNMEYDELESSDSERLENRNLLALLNDKGVCQGYIEILRNISAEYGIQVESIRGSIPVNGKRSSHEWSQVRLDGVWYDDDFTNYRESLSKDDLDACHCFLMGARSDGISSTKYVGYETRDKLHNVGKTPSISDKKFLLRYGRVQQQVNQQSIQESEKVKPQEKSIKDEIGDEVKPETEQQKQEEQQVETMWKNRFQSWDRDTAVLPDGAKRKVEVVRVMQDLQRQQDKEKQDQEQIENQANDQR